MLNKLLERCLPWMDKGRWYKITFEYDGENFNVIKKDDNVNYIQTASGSSFNTYLLYIKNAKKAGPWFVSVDCLGDISDASSHFISNPTPRVTNEHVGLSIYLYFKDMPEYRATFYIWNED